ncbi:hypothetical protein A3D84_03385 [Candidatus Woesebacteria bacterium RIFCSPHIGHO2_02_FULL_42_20]|uniref:N-acetyltransferase domain-containing protein n=1 Tax=Candidatus Woesebacteria bacterium RIFCSPHIGHO2_12_FULL_41_24 TaxID=1802510 RepID=A0A1F8AS71_9BACT|nr:MAG: hypothetical protein A2W15_02565 [Candidatus Woesebacteria bacterium RBG_16_41_13]OGM29174.1 MAG: hypothetical protein A2873_02760 [Candidatus Woesebacteria bacterium RIFCSPHIGHO2_01_FULL_42_80]OGM34919.1 MAG: hypothetical protein A3D84_03385 [Candidatus Woesebacteria bacterium RIFCSPHIGHO2_02_FULL_42_20]OGM54614.1 MAG: hypothetical protein A3E44_02550 [Candidatus Woesebacteria bacterium RIFCSPHIGHO2_12_FULL_41_24]OGM66897.1 MAG: hypothetical protein A2969_01645 [Candidatus Woesebacteri
MKKCDCVLCSFENPKVCSTAIIIKDQKMLVAKRAGSPFKGKWDFIGGYINKNESPEDAMKREIKEELGVNCKCRYLTSFCGTASYEGYGYPVLAMCYLVELSGKIKLNKKENSKLSWIPIKNLKTIAFDSNQKILKYVKSKFVCDLKGVRSLLKQLNPNIVFDEQSLYRATLNGYMSKVEKKGKLIGMGWIYPRQTLPWNNATIEDMIVDEKYRGQGLGEKILFDLIGWAKRNNIQIIELTTNPKRLAANSLYRKIGFQQFETNHYLLKLKK